MATALLPATNSYATSRLISLAADGNYTYVTRCPEGLMILRAECGTTTDVPLEPTQQQQSPTSIVRFRSPTFGATQISAIAPVAGRVAMRVYAPTGRLVWSWEGYQGSQEWSHVQWSGLGQNGERVASGVYYVQFTWQGGRSAKPIVLLR